MDAREYTVALQSVGCRTNQEEVVSLGRRLAAAGHRLVENVGEADVVVVNTCSVTAHTEAKTRCLIHTVSRVKPGVKILVTGCLAQHKPHELARKPGVAWVVGNARKDEIVSIIDRHADGVFCSPLTRKSALAVDTSQPPDAQEARRTRFSIKIQEGCDFACSYCIVPRLRGPSCCVPEADILSACARALEAGYKEIVLTGTHIGQYRGAARAYRLVELVRDILACESDTFRLRLSSLNPRDVSGELVSLMREDARMCDHFHVSIQSLSPQVLRRMNRSPDDVEKMWERLAAYRRESGRLALGADFIVGFPGETEEMFETTRTAVKGLGFAYGHVFRYSRRGGTEACGMARQVPETEKRARSEALRSALEKGRAAFVEFQRGREHSILVESSDPATGLTSNYLRVEIPGVCAGRNTWVKVAVKGYDARRRICIGERLA